MSIVTDESTQYSRSECWLLIAGDGGALALRQRHGWAILMPFWRQRKFPDFHYRRQQDIGDILQATTRYVLILARHTYNIVFIEYESKGYKP